MIGVIGTIGSNSRFMVVFGVVGLPSPSASPGLQPGTGGLPFNIRLKAFVDVEEVSLWLPGLSEMWDGSLIPQENERQSGRCGARQHEFAWVLACRPAAQHLEPAALQLEKDGAEAGGRDCPRAVLLPAREAGEGSLVLGSQSALPPAER